MLILLKKYTITICLQIVSRVTFFVLIFYMIFVSFSNRLILCYTNTKIWRWTGIWTRNVL